MDWNAAIEKNREALKRILAALAAMAGLVDGACAATLPRRLHNAVLRLLRPAEAATRRLIIVAARGMVVTLPPARPRKPKPASNHATLRILGIAVMVSVADIARGAAARRAASARAARPRSFPLLDPVQRPFRPRRKYVPAHAGPRIRSLFDDSPPAPVPFPRLPAPDDPINAARLGLRLQALGRALDNLPAQAKRFARWRACRDSARNQESSAQNMSPNTQNKNARKAGRFRRIWPLKPGSPPGLPRRATRRRPLHEVHEVLRVTHGLAFWALERPRPDTS